ncbi:type IV pilus assembly protein PilX [Halospina denitrificans]|uniref:Type IV pilus assembly protein PilX n=1 Tax=Halospina denitrificans TaxID=332522 RepID=A0A4R7JI20_9GAMM|nr:PilX N-terminal domain-containing pilus assembly protein [Halospina denitrificans]TDT37124.1 type IV pilus assembly protein PilX [Halospina denitrificans]
MRRTNQSGSALLLALIMLLVLSLLAISGMEGSVMQERMQSAQRQGAMALEISESGARDAEQWLEKNVVTLNVFDGTNGLYDATVQEQRAPDPFSATVWEGSSSKTATSVDGVTPRYFIEYMGRGFKPEQRAGGNISGYSHDSGAFESRAFRIVVHATSPSGKGSRLIEVYYTRKI